MIEQLKIDFNKTVESLELSNKSIQFRKKNFNQFFFFDTLFKTLPLANISAAKYASFKFTTPL